MRALDLDAIFAGAWVPPWLRRFEADPDAALGDLLVDRADLGHLSAAEPTELLLQWLDSLGERGAFAARLDEAITRWIERCWGIPALSEAAESASLTAVAWCRVSNVIAASTVLQQSAQCLRVRVPAEAQFLEAITEGRSRDPLGRAWFALAHHQQDRSLLDHWWRLCNLPPDEPWYRGVYGVHGLRGLPAPAGRSGGLPEEVPMGLHRLADALGQRVAEGWIEESVARGEFQRVAHQTMAAYPFREKWLSGWRQALQHIESAEVSGWVRGLFPGRLEPSTERKSSPGYPPHSEPYWKPRVTDIAARLGRGEAGAVNDAHVLLNEQETHARATGDMQYIVRSSCNFAHRVQETLPEQALEWAELARRFDPWNGYAWTISAGCLVRLRRWPEALATAEEAVRRFPDDVVARTGLGEVLKARGDLSGAEGIYRETVQRFPDNVVARNGLGEVLKARGDLRGAEGIYRETVQRFRDDVVAQNGLKAVVNAIRRKNAAAATEEAIGEFEEEPQHAGVTAISGEESASHSPRKSAAPIDSRDVQLILTDAYVLRRWGHRSEGAGGSKTTGDLRDRARSLLERLILRDSRAAGELGSALITSGDLEEAAELLRHAAARFPGSARVRYTLARAERALALQAGRRLDEEGAPGQVIQPWRRLGRLDARYSPVEWLGEARAWLALVDGFTVEQKAKTAFGRLGHWTRQRLSDAPESKSLDTFPAWWAREVQTHLFGSGAVCRYEDLPNLSELRDRVIQHGGLLDTLEEEFVWRYAPA